MTNLRDLILKSDDKKSVSVEVPEWGVTVHVRVMSGLARDRFDSLLGTMSKNKNLDNIRAALTAFTACDENGAEIFKPEDIEELGQKSSAALDRIFAVAQRINCLSEQDIDELKKN